MLGKIISLDHMDKIEVGNKASRLAVLLKNNIPIPNGCVYIIHDSIDFKQVFDDCFASLKPPYILRSSFAIEDGDFLSFACIFESIINITSKSEFQLAINKIIESTTSEKIKTYASIYNIDISTLKPIVLIQEYKEPVISGVVFTENPNDKNLLLIEYSKEAEGITSGQSEAVQVIIDKRDQKIIQHSESQDFFEKEILELFKYSLEIEKIFGCPQDIEWLFDGQKIWILQSRNITASNLNKFVNNEFDKLKIKFGEPTPIFARKLFTEEIEYITPITLSIFRRFYSKNGAFGKVMKQLYVPLKSFDENKYIVDIFSRPYINETLEKQFFTVDYKQTATEALFSSVKQTFKKPLSLITITINLFRSIFLQVILQIKLFILYRKLDSDVKKLLVIINKTKEFGDISGQDKIKNYLQLLEKVVVPKLFILSIFQEYLYLYLRKKVKNNISEEEWNDFISIGKKQIISNENEPINSLELSANRNGILNDFEKLISKKISNRENILERYQDVWVRQILGLYAEMYDAFSATRELLHIELVKIFNHLHNELSTLDREYFLYNSIWFTTIDEITDISKLNRSELFQKKKASEYLRKIDIPSKIQVKNWGELIEQDKLDFDNKNAINGEMLSMGSAHGIVGTREMLEKKCGVDILLTNHIDPGIVAFYPKIKGIITLTGGELSHATILAREFGIPMIKISNYPKHIIGKTVYLDAKNKKLIID
ncbi:MAG: PEP-utilizing enzyme [Candidatus Nomurabacteria bacterium]|nr:PEP-utilizing enzyme [Candidatus Nomurabacteria bacterium]